MQLSFPAWLVRSYTYASISCTGISPLIFGSPCVQLVGNALLCIIYCVQVRAYKQLLPLAGAVEHVRSGAPLPAAHVAAASPYTVQYIDLGIRTA